MSDDLVLPGFKPVPQPPDGRDEEIIELQRQVKYLGKTADEVWDLTFEYKEAIYALRCARQALRDLTINGNGEYDSDKARVSMAIEIYDMKYKKGKDDD